MRISTKIHKNTDKICRTYFIFEIGKKFTKKYEIKKEIFRFNKLNIKSLTRKSRKIVHRSLFKFKPEVWRKARVIYVEFGCFVIQSLNMSFGGSQRLVRSQWLRPSGLANEPCVPLLPPSEYVLLLFILPGISST